MSPRRHQAWPGVKGGQGRSDEDVEMAATGLTFAALWVLLLSGCGLAWYFIAKGFFF